MTILGRLFVFLIVLCFSYIPEADAVTHAASGCAQTDVQAAIAASSNGDTVSVPACACGTVTWSSAVSMSKSVTVAGQGSGNTCIQGYGFITVSGVNGWHITGMKWSIASTSPSYVIKVTSGTDYNGTPITGWIVDNNIFDGYGNSTVEVRNGSTGMIANNLFSNTNGNDAIIYVYGRDSVDWSSSSPVGTANNYVFIEDNKFIAATGATNNHAVLAGWGGSYVFRCNEITYAGSGTYKDMIDAHGYGHGTNRRSTRAYEVYGNHLSNNNYQSRTVNLRGGTGRLFSNRWTSANTFIGLTDYRIISTGLSMAYPTNTNDCTSSSASCTSTDEANCCALHEGQACCDQIGRGQDGAGGARQGSDPLYFWDNKTDAGGAIALTSDNSSYIQLNRDYYSGSIPVGYTPYAYPHPSRGLSQTTTCLTDSNSQAKTGIKFWDSSGVVVKPSPPNLR